MGMEVFLQKERIFLGAHEIGAAISGPRIADTNFTDTRIFLKLVRICILTNFGSLSRGQSQNHPQ